MSKNLIYLNGEIIAESEARIPCLDPGFLYGQGLFETMRSYDGVVFQLDNHLRRLSDSLFMISIDLPYSLKELKEAIKLTLKANNLFSAYIRLNVWQGKDEANVCIITKEFNGYPEDLYKRGFKAKVMECRQNERSLLANIKSINYLQFYLSRIEAEGEGFDEAILLNSKDKLCEGSRSNIFLVKGDDIITPSLENGCLAGITRGAVIDLIKKSKYKFHEKNILLDDLLKADEAFLTGSLLEVMPLTSIDNQGINTGLPGPATLSLLKSYRQSIEQIE